MNKLAISIKTLNVGVPENAKKFWDIVNGETLVKSSTKPRHPAKTQVKKLMTILLIPTKWSILEVDNKRLPPMNTDEHRYGLVLIEVNGELSMVNG